MKFPDDSDALGAFLRILDGPVFLFPEDNPRVGCLSGRHNITPSMLPVLCTVGLPLPPWWAKDTRAGFKSMVREALAHDLGQRFALAAAWRLILWGGVPPSRPVHKLNGWRGHDPSPVYPIHCAANLPRCRPDVCRTDADAVVVMSGARIVRTATDEEGPWPDLAILSPCLLLPLQWFISIRIPTKLVGGTVFEVASEWLAHLADAPRSKVRPWRRAVCVEAAEAAASAAGSLGRVEDIGMPFVDLLRARNRARARSLTESVSDSGLLLSPSSSPSGEFLPSR